MASPPPGGGAYSASSPLALPRQRPALALPRLQAPQKSRKPSVASISSNLSAHPLRQTSFPPPDTLEAQHALAEDAQLRQYSPAETDNASLDDFSDTEITSAISRAPSVGGVDEPFPRKRKRGEKRARGRPPKYPPNSSLRNSSVGVGQANGRGAQSVAAGEDAEGEEDDDDEGDVGAGGGRVPIYEGGQMTQAELSQQRERQRLFYEAATEEQKERLRSFGQAKLRTADVRRLVNQTLSQSVPQSVVLVVSSYVKMFAGMLIEEAREVQKEWVAVEEKRADGEENRALKRLKLRKAGVQEEEDREMESGQTNSQPNGEVTRPNTATSTLAPNYPSPSSRKDNEDSIFPLNSGGAGGLSAEIPECDRGPLLPDHLREALRRYRKRRGGGSVGFTGLSLEGKENTAAAMGGAGRRLFR